MGGGGRRRVSFVLLFGDVLAGPFEFFVGWAGRGCLVGSIESGIEIVNLGRYQRYRFVSGLNSLGYVSLRELPLEVCHYLSYRLNNKC